MPRTKMGRSPLAKVPTPKISVNLDDSRLAYTMREVADAIGASEKTIWTLIKSGKLRSVKLGRLVRIPADAVAELLGGGS